MVDKDIGFIRLARLDDETEMLAIEKAASIKDARAFIVDLRDCPGGYLHSAFRLSALFVRDGLLGTIEFRQPGDISNPSFGNARIQLSNGNFAEESASGSKPHILYLSTRLAANPCLSGKPIAVLINSHTSSGAELLAGILRERAGAVLIGAKSFGKGTFQSTVPIGFDNDLVITTGKFFLPSGYWLGDGATDKRGLQPDRSVLPSSGKYVPGSTTDEDAADAVEYLNLKLPK